MEISVSIVIPTLNRRDFLIEAIDSCLNQTWEISQIVVADNGSVDGTVSMALPSGVELVVEPEIGVGNARNNGLSVTSSSHVIFLDSDDLLVPNAVETLVNLAKRDEAHVSYGALANFKSIAGKLIIGKTTSHPSASSSLIQVKTFEEFGLFKGDNYSFPNWILELGKTKARFAQVDDVVCLRRIHDSNMGHTKESRDYYIQLVRDRLADRNK